MKRFAWFVCALTAACGDNLDAKAPDAAPTIDGTPAASLASVKNIVVIYAENRGFDGTYAPQLDRDGNPLAKLPMAWTGVTAAGYVPAIAQASSDNIANGPYS